MPTARICFFGELNDFFTADQRDISKEIVFKGHETVKHLVEALGVPHTEVDVIVVNRVSVTFDYHVMEGDNVKIYPRSESVNVKPLIQLRNTLPSEPCFVLDGHLGKLARYLRLLGFDSRYKNDMDDRELADISSLEERVLLTRDRGLLMRSQVVHGYWVRSKSPHQQTIEVIQRFDLDSRIRLFSRCARCNGVLEQVPKAEVYDRLEPKTQKYYDVFQKCGGCDQVYWRGSHVKRMENQFQTFINPQFDEENLENDL